MQSCKALNCTGTYVNTIISYRGTRSLRGTQLTCEEYNSLPIDNRKNLYAVGSIKCSICKDDLDDRLSTQLESLCITCNTDKSVPMFNDKFKHHHECVICKSITITGPDHIKNKRLINEEHIIP